MSRVIKSILDNDLYKFRMMNAVFLRYRDVHVKYAFSCRSGENLLPYMEEIKREIAWMQTIGCSASDVEFLRSLGGFDEGFLNSLKSHIFYSQRVHLFEKNGQLAIEIEGPWHMTILWEVPILAIVNEVYFKYRRADVDWTLFRSNLDQKLELLKKHEINISEFGTRRRFSTDVQEIVVNELMKATKNFSTSNVMLAKEKGLLCVGTMAHEWLMAHQSLTAHFDSFQVQAIKVWKDIYGEDNTVALTDVCGHKRFMIDYLTNLDVMKCGGFRHDSGDPLTWAHNMIHSLKAAHGSEEIQKKKLVFSDGLTVQRAIEIQEKVREEFINHPQLIFGIGTSLTNDMPGTRPLSIVMKMVECQGKPVYKVTDDPGKKMGHETENCPVYRNLCNLYV